MYTNVSDEFKAAVSLHSRHFAAKLDFGDTVIGGNQIYKISYSGGSSATDYLTLGSVMSASVKLEIAETPLKLLNKQFTLYIGLETDEDSGAIEYIPQGRYKVTDAQTKDGKTTIDAQDALFASDITYNSEISYPAKISDILTEMTEKTGIEFAENDYPDYEIKSNPSGYTIREILGFFGGMWGAFAMCDRQGRVTFRWYSDSGYSVNLDTISPPEMSEGRFCLAYIMCYTGSDDYLERGDAESGSKIIIENPYVTTDTLARVFTSVEGFEYQPTKVKCMLGDPRVDVWDIIKVHIGSGNRVNVPVMQYTWEFDGGFSSEITAPIETESDTEQREGSIARRKSEKDSSGLSVFYSALSTDKTIQTVNTEVLSISYSAEAATVPIFGVTAAFEITKLGEVDFIVISDNAVMCTFTESFDTGNRFKAITLPLLGVSSGSHEVQLAVKSLDASGKLLGGGCYGYVFGGNLAENTAWNGTISFRETFSAVSAGEYNTSLKPISNSLVSCEPLSPICNVFGESYTPWAFGGYGAELVGLSAEIPPECIRAYAADDSTIIVEFGQPIACEDWNAALGHFAVAALLGNVPTYIEVLEVQPHGVSSLSLSTAAGTIKSGTISVTYTKGSIIGTITLLDDFMITFEIAANTTEEVT